jgi:hypothetical protein
MSQRSLNGVRRVAGPLRCKTGIATLEEVHAETGKTKLPKVNYRHIHGR